MHCRSLDAPVVLFVALLFGVTLAFAPSRVAAQAVAPTSTPPPELSAKARADTLAVEGLARFGSSDYEAAKAAFAQAIPLYREAGAVSDEAGAQVALGLIQTVQGQHAGALRAYQDALALWRSLGERQMVGRTLNSIGWSHFRLGQITEAKASFSQALETVRAANLRDEERQALAGLAGVHYALSEYTDAVAHYLEALAIARELGDQANEMTLLMALGPAYGALSQHDRALDAYAQALSLARRAADRRVEAQALGQLGFVSALQRRYDRAIEYELQALALAREQRDRAGEAQLLHGIGTVYEDTWRPAEALEVYREALVIERQLRNRSREALNLRDIGSALQTLGRNDEAASAYQEAAAIFGGVGDTAGENGALNNLGQLYATLGRTQEAERLLEAVVGRARQAGDRRGAATALSNLGTVYSMRGEYERALAAQANALAAVQELGDRSNEATILNNLGLTYDRSGRYDDARDRYDRSLAIHRELADRSGEARTLNNLGGLAENYGRFTDALRLYQQALDVFQGLGAASEEAAALNNIGGVYERLGQPQRAVELYRQALEIRRRLGEQLGQAAALNNIGSVEARWGNYVEALASYEQALPLAQQAGDRALEAGIRDNTGGALGQLGRTEAARAAHQQALAIRRALGLRADEALSLNNIGAIHVALDQLSEALDRFDEALAIQREIGDEAGEAVTLSNIAYVRRLEGQLPAALDAYQQAIAIIERQRSTLVLEELRTGLTSDWAATYAAAVELLLQLGRSEEAFGMAERGRARALLDQLAGGRVAVRSDYRQGADAALLDQEETLRADLARLDRLLRQERARPSVQRSAEQSRTLADQLSRKQHEYDALMSRIKLSAPDYAGLVTGSPLGWGEVQELLPPKVTLLSYYLTPERSLAFVANRQALHVVELPVTPAKLREATVLSRDSILAQDVAPHGLAALSDWLIAPLRPYLTTPMVGIVPHDVLHYLPFSALPASSTGGIGQRFLGDEFVLFILPSASTLPFVRGDTVADASGAPALPLLVAAYGRAEGLPPLRFAEKEGQEIAGLFDVAPLVGSAATESAVREQASRARFIHIAAHGQLNAANPLFSRLVLAPDQAHDGSLEVHEVFGLDLRHADLVTLSACQTQLGVRSGGDDLIGLSRAFIAGAGAPTVVASLWSVDDEATAALMKAFYAGMRDGLRKAEALRVAQAAVRNDKTHPEWARPYYWAAFTLTGEPGAVKSAGPRDWRPWGIGVSILGAALAGGVASWRLRRRRRRQLAAG